MIKGEREIARDTCPLNSECIQVRSNEEEHATW